MAKPGPVIRMKGGDVECIRMAIIRICENPPGNSRPGGPNPTMKPATSSRAGAKSQVNLLKHRRLQVLRWRHPVGIA